MLHWNDHFTLLIIMIYSGFSTFLSLCTTLPHVMCPFARAPRNNKANLASSSRHKQWNISQLDASRHFIVKFGLRKASAAQKLCHSIFPYFEWTWQYNRFCLKAFFKTIILIPILLEFGKFDFRCAPLTVTSCFRTFNSLLTWST